MAIMITSKTCDICHKGFGPGEKRRTYVLYNQGVSLKIHIACFRKIKQYCLRHKWQISRLVYSLWIGIKDLGDVGI